MLEGSRSWNREWDGGNEGVQTQPPMAAGMEVSKVPWCSSSWCSYSCPLNSFLGRGGEKGREEIVCDVLSAVWQVIFRVLVLNTFQSILDLVREEKNSPFLPRSHVTMGISSLGIAKVLALGLCHLPQVTSCRKTRQSLVSVPGMSLLSPLARGRLEMQLLSLQSAYWTLGRGQCWRLGDKLENFSRFRI